MTYGLITGWEDCFRSLSNPLGITQTFHPKQMAIHNDHASKRVVIGSRRSGKTRYMFGEALELADQHPGETVAYCGLTIKATADLVFPKAIEFEKEFNVKLDCSTGDYDVRTPNGGRVQIFGLSTKPEAEKGRGPRFPGVFIDEAGAIPDDNLRLAVAETFGPATADFLGKGGRGVTIAGTPPYLLDSYFEELCGGNTHESPGVSVHHMTIHDNPFGGPGHAERVIEDWLHTNNLTPESSQFKREWMGLFCIDTFGLCYNKWNGNVLPHSSIPLSGVTVMGLDLGFTHPNAWVIARIVPTFSLGLDSNQVEVHNVIHLLESYEQSGMTIQEIANETKELASLWNVGTIYADGGGGGRQMVHDLQVGHNIPLENYKALTGVGSKASRIWNINGMLGSGRMQVHEGCGSLISQLKSVPWSDDKTDHNERYPDHSLDGMIYSSMHPTSLITRSLAVPPRPGSPEWVNMEHERDIRRMQRSRKAKR